MSTTTRTYSDGTPALKFKRVHGEYVNVEHGFIIMRFDDDDATGGWVAYRLDASRSQSSAGFYFTDGNDCVATSYRLADLRFVCSRIAANTEVAA